MISKLEKILTHKLVPQRKSTPVMDLLYTLLELGRTLLMFQMEHIFT